jgi:hypothetical protein
MAQEVKFAVLLLLLDQGNVSGVTLGGALIFMTVVTICPNDNLTKISYRCKNSRPGAHHNGELFTQAI